MRPEGGQGRLEEGGLAGAGAGDEAGDEDAGFGETLAQIAGEEVVLLQQALADLDDSRLHLAYPRSTSTFHPLQQDTAASSVTSRAKSSRSRPPTTSGVGVSHTGQWKCCTLGSTRRAS